MRAVVRAAALAALSSLSIALPQITILPLGDSITFGCGSDAAPPDWYACCPSSSGGYRAPLWAALNGSAINATVQFVGTESSGPAWVPLSQRAHEGHPGWTSSRIAGLKPTWTKLAPDVVLLMSGTNDLGQKHANATAIADLGALLASLRASLPAARIFVCSILSFFDSQNPWLPAAVAAYNAAIPALAAQNGATFVDINRITQLCRGPQDPLAYPLCAVCNGPCGGYNPASCPSGGGFAFCHPTGAGYSLVAGAWASALLPVLGEIAAARA
jgi:lysophospholipase L1-like esterase